MPNQINQVTVYPISPEEHHQRDWVFDNPIAVAIISTVLFVAGSLFLLFLSVRYGGRDEDEEDEETEYDDESQIHEEMPGTRGHSFIIMETPPSEAPSVKSSPRPSHIMIPVPSARPSFSQSSRRRISAQKTRKKTLSLNPVFSISQRKSVPSRPKGYDPNFSSGRIRWSTAGYGSPGASFQVLTGGNSDRDPPPMFLLSVPVDDHHQDGAGGGGGGDGRKLSAQSHRFYAAQPFGETNVHHQRSFRERKRKKGLAIPPVFMSNQRKCNFKQKHEATLSPKTNARRMRWSTFEIPAAVNREVVREQTGPPVYRRTFSEIPPASYGNVLDVPGESHG